MIQLQWGGSSRLDVWMDYGCKFLGYVLERVSNVTGNNTTCKDWLITNGT